jgi:hypothetical protein
VLFFLFRLPVADSEGSFSVESSLSLDLWVHVLIEDSTDIHVFEIQSPSGQIFSFPKYDAGLVYFSLRGPRETGVWSYRIRLYAGSATRSMLLECWAAGGADQVNLATWSRVAEEGEGRAGSPPPAFLYARLEQAGLPVLSAQVTALVHGPPGSEPPVNVIQLVDDGAGYPDITRGDGIYSAYFTQFSLEAAGLYSLEVEADNNGTAGVLNVRRSETPPADCCGSSLPTSPVVPLESFRRFSTAPAFYYAPSAWSVGGNRTGGQTQQRDLFPPNRISDFRLANYFNNSLFVTLAWTAPGDNLTGGGPTFRYEIRCFTDRSALSEVNFAEQGILVHASLVPSPGDPGTEQRSTVAVPWAREVFYYAMVAIDVAGNRGEVSNIIAVFVEEPVVVAEAVENSTIIYMNMEDLGSNNNMLLQSVLQSDSLMYIIAGVISLILIIIVLVLAIIIKRLGVVVCGIGSKQSKPSSSSSANDSLEEESDSSSSPYHLPDMCPDSGSSFARNSVSYVSGYDLADSLEFALRSSPQKAAAQEMTNNNHRVLDPRYYCTDTSRENYYLPAAGLRPAGYLDAPILTTGPPPPATGAQQSPSISPVNSTYTAHSTDCSVSVSSSDPDQLHQPPPPGTEGSLQVLAPGGGGGSSSSHLQVLPAGSTTMSHGSGGGGQFQLAYQHHSHESILGSRRSRPPARKVPPAVPSKTVHASLV